MFGTNAISRLRTVLLFDAGTCLLMGIMLISSNALLAELTAIPSTLLMFVGDLLLPIAIFIAVVACKALQVVSVLRMIIAGNALWIAASIMLMLGSWISPNVFGYVFITVQAAVVLVLTALEYQGMGQIKEANFQQ